MGEYMKATDRYMRLALKAQSQRRAIMETLAAIKNPPVVYAKQANIANGPQQGDNGIPCQFPPAQAGNSSAQTKLLEESYGGAYLDARAAGTAATGDPALETVGAVSRAKKPRGKDKD